MSKKNGVAQAWRNRIIGHGTKPASEFVANPGNWRIHPTAQAQALAGVLSEVGWVQDVVENTQTGNLIDGHLRVMEALRLGDETPVPYVEVDLSPEEEALVLATIDPLSAMAVADKQKLDELLREVSTSEAAVQKMLAELAKASGLDYGKPAVEDPGAQIDKAEELRAKWQTELGQLWVIPSKSVQGKAHRLLCGDSTKAEDVTRLMAGEKAVLMATDPPYGVDFEGAKYNPRAKEWDGIAGDKRQGRELQDWLENCLKTWFPSMASDAAFYLWTAAMEEGSAAAAAIRSAGLHIQSQIIWNKNTLILGQADYQWKHENCWYAFWKGKNHRWLGGRDKTTVWDIKKVANSAYMHPMQKPVELYSIPMDHHMTAGEVCAEPFTGSGGQFVAAEQTGRLCYGMEIEPKYVAVTLERLSSMGLEPRLLETAPTVGLQEAAV